MRQETEQKAIKILASSRIFSAADKAQLSVLVNDADTVLREFTKGQQIFPCHGIRRAVGVLLTGGCQVSKGKLIISTAEPGYIFGAVTLYNDSEDFVTAISATKPSKVLFIGKNAIDRLLQSNFEVAKGYLAYLSERVYFLSGKIDAISSGSGEEKLARFLLERRRNEKGEVELPLNVSKLAQQLGIGRASLYRAFDRLNSSGAIMHNGKSVCIVDEEKLKEFVL